MRIRTRAIIATAGLAVATVALSAAPASAKLPEASEQCIKLLEANGSINDCQQAPSPLKPETNEILWGSAAFLVLLVAMWKWGVPAVKNMEKAREDRIRGDLEGAEHA